MSVLRVIAVENVSVGSSDSVEPAIACVFKNNKFHVYDTFGELYHQKEYFNDFDSLEYLINKGKYDWVDFEISKGQLLGRDIYNNIVVEGEIKEEILPLNQNSGFVNNTSLSLFYNFLNRVYKDEPETLDKLKEDYESGTFQREIETIICSNPLKGFIEGDKELIIRGRIEGYDFIKYRLRNLATSVNPLKIDQITFFFTRLFKLEKANYLDFSNID